MKFYELINKYYQNQYDIDNLIELHQNIFAIAYKFIDNWIKSDNRELPIETNDFYSTSYLVLIRCLNYSKIKFEAMDAKEFCSKFISLYFIACKNEIINNLKSLKVCAKEVKYEDIMLEQKHETIHFAYQDNYRKRLILQQCIRDSFRLMNPIQRKIVYMKYYGASIEEISKKLKLSPRQVMNAYYKIRENKSIKKIFEITI